MHEKDLFKELAYAILKVDKSQDLQTNTLEIRRTSGRVLDQNSAGLRLKRADVSVRVKAGKNYLSPTQGSQAEKFPLICKGE